MCMWSVSIIFILNAHVSDNSLSEVQCLNKDMLTAPPTYPSWIIKKDLLFKQIEK